MKINALGKFLRKLRLDSEELMADMASKLGISVSGLSYIETGERAFKKDKLYSKLIKSYNLDAEKIKELDDAIELSKPNICMKNRKANNEQKDIVFALARKMERLSPDDIENIKRILGDI